MPLELVTARTQERPDELPPHLVAVLRFAARHETHTTAALTTAVRQAFGLSLLRYYQRLNLAVTHPTAEALEPALVRRLRARVIRRQRMRRAGTNLPTPRGA